MHKELLSYFSIFLFFATLNVAVSQDNLEIKPKNGDGVNTLLSRYGLIPNKSNTVRFNELNSGKFTKKGGLILSNLYKMPIKVYKYNGKSIRSTLNNNDLEYAKEIQKYNENLFASGVKPKDYRDDLVLWVPETDFHENMVVSNSEDKVEDNLSLKVRTEPLFGEKYKTVQEISKSLAGGTYYISPGHGGPDPGAQAQKDNHTLSEDEYAYDVSLRLARKIMEHGGDVHIITQDPKDGIRDDVYLNNSSLEYHYGAEEIPLNQLERLKRRANIVNDLYYQNVYQNSRHHLICTHVDSRIQKDKQIDIYFYYKSTSEQSKQWASQLLTTIEEKYRNAQPNRGYNGTVTARDELYMIRKTVPVTTYIELGNIQNTRDQQRILDPNNRQAIANWLADGLIKIAESEDNSLTKTKQKSKKTTKKKK